MSRVYVASSWKNMLTLDSVIDGLREVGHVVYDFREGESFHWSLVRPGYREEMLEATTYLEMLGNAQAISGFERDMRHLYWADITICVLPCGRSAHLETGFAAGRDDKRSAVFLGEYPVQPELMYLMTDFITGSIPDLIEWTLQPEQTFIHSGEPPYVPQPGGFRTAREER